MPAPPKPGMFGGKIRIVTGSDEPVALVQPVKPQEPPAEAPKAPPPEPPKPPPPPIQAKPLDPGQSVRFDDDQTP